MLGTQGQGTHPGDAEGQFHMADRWGSPLSWTPVPGTLPVAGREEVRGSEAPVCCPGCRKLPLPGRG